MLHRNPEFKILVYALTITAVTIVVEKEKMFCCKRQLLRGGHQFLADFDDLEDV